MYGRVQSSVRNPRARIGKGRLASVGDSRYRRLCGVCSKLRRNGTSSWSRRPYAAVRTGTASSVGRRCKALFMNVLFVAGFAVISNKQSEDLRLFVDVLGLPLRPPMSVPDSEYRYSEGIAGVKHFGVWPLSEAAHACFGTETWPATHPIPQSTIEFEVDDVEAAAAELHREGYGLVTRSERSRGGKSSLAFNRQMASCLGSAPHPIWRTRSLAVPDHLLTTADPYLVDGR